MDWELRFQEVDGVRVRYAVAGEGPPVVLIHGLGASWVCWWENIGPLSTHFRVYALDLPGHGESEALPHGMDNPRAGAEFMVRFLDAVGVQRASLVGNSAGGALAANVAYYHPERVERLVLVDAAGLGRSVSWFLRLASLPVVGWLLHLRTLPTDEVVMRELFYRPRAFSPEMAQEFLRTRNSRRTRDTVVRVVHAGIDLGGIKRELLVVDKLRAVKVPILIVWGREDRVLPVSHAYQAAAALPHARLEVLPECGHWPQMEKAEEFNRLVVGFLSAVADGREAARG